MATLSAEMLTASPGEQQLAFRIGLDPGDVIVGGDVVFGKVVDVAARIEALAEPGGIAVSAAVRDQLAGKRASPLDVAPEDPGAHRLKNVQQPIHIFAVGKSASGARHRRPRRRLMMLGALLAATLVGGSVHS